MALFLAFLAHALKSSALDFRKIMAGRMILGSEHAPSYLADYKQFNFLPRAVDG